jgi:hypothetical protein
VRRRGQRPAAASSGGTTDRSCCCRGHCNAGMLLRFSASQLLCWPGTQRTALSSPAGGHMGSLLLVVMYVTSARSGNHTCNLSTAASICR